MVPPVVCPQSFKYNQLWPCTSLQHLIETSLVPDDGAYPDCKKLLPASSLKTILSKSRVKQTLKCRCPNCHEQRLTGRHYTEYDELKILGRRHDLDTGFMAVFAILGYIQNPCLIAWFLDANITDAFLRRSLAAFTPEYISSFISSRICDASLLASRFAQEKWRFMIPSMSTPKYEEYHESVMLPFINRYVMEEGVMGTVYMIEMLDGYSFRDYPDCKVFARKQLKDRDPKNFAEQLHHLQLLNELEDPYIVKLIKPYKHGDDFNLIFPLADMNAQDYFQVHTSPSTSSTASLRDHPAWSQMRGLADSLGRIQESFASSSPHFCVHMDLKPENILIFDGDWKISDFGSSSHPDDLEMAHRGESQRTGTRTYGAPECQRGLPADYMRPEADLWSYGCVASDLATWIISGNMPKENPEVGPVGRMSSPQRAKQEGVRSLSATQTLKTGDKGPVSDEPFWIYDELYSQYKINPTRIEQMESLRHFANEEDDKLFVDQMLDLILNRMLVVEPSKRASFKEISARLADILRPPSEPPSIYNCGKGKGKAKVDEWFGSGYDGGGSELDLDNG